MHRTKQTRVCNSVCNVLYWHGEHYTEQCLVLSLYYVALNKLQQRVTKSIEPYMSFGSRNNPCVLLRFSYYYYHS